MKNYKKITVEVIGRRRCDCVRGEKDSMSGISNEG